MKALICGVTGQDGTYLAQLLLGKGYEVWGTSRDAPASRADNLEKVGVAGRVQLLSMAPADFPSVRRAIEKSRPQEIYYLAGQSSVGLSFEQPAQTLESIVSGVLNILEVVRLQDKSIRFYNAGSSECFGDTAGLAASENTPFHPRSPYAVAKASAHWLVANYREAYGIHACTGMLFNHESPLRPKRFVTQKIIQAAASIAAGSQETLTLGRLDVQRDWGWAPEYVDAMWRMLQHEQPTDLVIATGEAHPLEEFVRLAFEVHDLDWHDHVASSSAFFRPSDIDVSRGDPALAARELGWIAARKLKDVVQGMSAGLAQ